MAKQKSGSLSSYLVSAPPVFTPIGGKFDSSQSGIGAGTAMSASFNDAWTTGSTGSLNRILKGEILGNLTHGKTGFNEKIPIGETARSYYADVQDGGMWVKYDDAIKDINAAGFTHRDIPISSEGVNIAILKSIIDAAKEQRVRRGFIQRGERAHSVKMMAAGFAASIVDPIDLLASVVIPASSVSRAKHLAKLKPLTLSASRNVIKRGAVRAMHGIVDGAIGAAAVSPIPIIAASYDGIQYTMDNAMQDVLFGAMMGAGMSVPAGHIGDMLGRRHIPTGINGDQLKDMPSDFIRANIEVMMLSMKRGRKIDVDGAFSHLVPKKMATNKTLFKLFKKAYASTGQGMTMSRRVRSQLKEIAGIDVPADRAYLRSEFVSSAIHSGLAPDGLDSILRGGLSFDDFKRSFDKVEGGKAELLSKWTESINEIDANYKKIDKALHSDLRVLLGEKATNEEILKKMKDIEVSQDAHISKAVAGYEPPDMKVTIAKLHESYLDPKTLDSYNATVRDAVEAEAASPTVKKRVKAPIDDKGNTVLSPEMQGLSEMVASFEEKTGLNMGVARDLDAVRAKSKMRSDVTEQVIECLISRSG